MEIFLWLSILFSSFAFLGTLLVNILPILTTFTGITNPFRFRECLRILKKMVINKYFQHFINLPNPTSSGSTMAKSSSSNNVPHEVSSTDDQRNRPSEDQAGCNDIQVHRLDQTGRNSSMMRYTK